MASLTMTPLDSQRPAKRFRRGTTGDTPRNTYIIERTRGRPVRSSSTSSYTHSSRRSSTATTPGSNSLSHSAYSLSRSQTSSFTPSSPFIATLASSSSRSRSRSAAEARARVLDPAYSGVGQTQARVYVDELGIAHDPDYRMFPPVVPSSPRSCTARRGSMTSARGRCSISIGGCSESPFTGSPFAGYADFEMHYSNSASHEVDTDEDQPMCMDVDEDAESVIEWSRLHASVSPPGYGEGNKEEEKTPEDGYADFAGMEWDEKEWRREEVVPVTALDKHQSSSLASSKGKQSTPSPAPLAPIQTTTFSRSNTSLSKSYPKAAARSKPKSSSKVGSVSSTARGYVPAKRSYDESVQDEWTPSCGYSVRRHWQSFTLRIRFTVFRWRRRLRRAFTSSSSGTGVEPRA
ncbi:unnamed protein product [Rhizoctonia solani]|uniref:Uncharacterized protein n=1 Tax=Rhizoctonia solani TaxID=456999 RepID=A0A8H3B2T0_9AGAM|nr:unnamed protein product [Rhizoctonia solani]CAE6446149.1 unnamed protein product [Rhizoctonia solani]